MAQRFDFDLFTVDDGLSDRQINELYVDKDGFLWVGTQDGLNRFDGKKFLHFGQGPFSNRGLSLGNIDEVGSDLENKLTVFYKNFTGYFDRIDLSSFEVEQVELNPSSGIEGLSKDLTIDELGRVFVVAVDREKTTLYEYTSDGFVPITSLDEDRKRISSDVNLLPLRNGQLLLFDAEYGLRRFSATGVLIDNIALTQLNIAPTNNNGRYERLEFLKQSPDGKVYFSFYGHPGLYELDMENQQRLSLAKGFPVDVYYTQARSDTKGQLLFFGNDNYGDRTKVKHFYLIDEDGEIHNYKEIGKINRRIYGATAFDFREKIFLGLSDGLGVLEWHGNKLDNYLTVDQEEELFQKLVRGITEDNKGNIYFTDDEGAVYKLDPQTGMIDSLRLHLEDGSLLNIIKCNQLIYDADHNMIWGSGRTPNNVQSGVLFSYNLTSCKTKAFWYDEGPFTCMFRTKRGEIYLGSANAATPARILFFEQESELFLPVMNSEGENVINNARPYCIQESKDEKTLYVGTAKGLFLIDASTRKTQTYEPKPWKSSDVVFNDYTIYTIVPLDNRAMYLGTRGGLHYFDPEKKEVKHYGRKDGMASNVVSSIIPDKAGDFWVSTYNGLSHFTPKDEPTFKNYSRSDGLSNDEFNAMSGYRSRAGRYYFGGVNGLTTFFPDQLNKLGDPPKVLISEVILYGKEERSVVAGLNKTRKIHVRKDEKGIAIHFTLPAGEIASRHGLKVKLEGLNDDWVYLGNERTVRFNSLSSGIYRLIVQASDESGNYREERAKDALLSIHVSRYFYEETWFLIITGLLAASFIIGFLQVKYRERLRNEQLRIQLSSDIHDEVSGLLAGITMQTELLQSYTEDEHLRTRLKGVGEAGRKAMSKMSDVIWSIDSRRDTTGDLLQRMQEHADDVLLPLDIRYSFNVSGLEDKARQLAGNKRQDLYFIYKEIVNNIARHSNPSRVNIYLNQQGGEFEMMIVDDGEPTNGFDARKSAKTGQGLANLRMRAKRLDAELTIDKGSNNAVKLSMKRL